jgi:hypothetical protein
MCMLVCFHITVQLNAWFAVSRYVNGHLVRRARHIIWFEQQAAGSAALQVHTEVMGLHGRQYMCYAGADE